MKIQKIIIKDFRIFNGMYEFDFKNKDVIIISGPNGNGKSTIFDSIQWCLTGKIPRYEGSDEWRKFNYLMNENIFKTEGKQYMFVEIWLQTNEGYIYKIRRIQKKDSEGKLQPSKVIINGKNFSMTQGIKEIREILTRDGLENKRSGKNNEINMPAFFASTQLLSQDALHNFIRADKPTERYKLINEILGIGKYGEDFERFIELARKEIEEKRNKLSDALKEPRAELNRISIEISEKEKIQQGIGEASEQELIKATEQLLFEAGRLGIFEEKLLSVGPSLNQVVLAKLHLIKEDIKKFQEHYEGIKFNVDNAREIFSLTPQTYIDNKTRVENQLKVLKSKKDRRKQGRSIINERKIVLDSLKIKRKKYQKEKEYYDVLKIKMAESHLDIKNTLSHVDVVKVINKFGGKQIFIDTYESYLQEKDIVKKALKCIEIDCNLGELKDGRLIQLNGALEYGKQLNEYREKLRIVSNKSKEIADEISEKKSSTVEELIRQVQGHILDEETETICPVCGIDHKSNADLKSSITEKIKSFSERLSDLERVFFELKAAESKYTEAIRLIESKKEKVESEIAASKKLEESLNLEKEKLMTDVPQINLYLSNADLNELNKVYEKKEKFLSDYRIPFGMLKSLEKKEEVASRIESDVLSQKKVLEEKRDAAQRWSKYLDLEEKEINRKIQKINNYIVSAEEESVRLHQKIMELSKEVITLDEVWEQREKKIKELQKEDESFKGDILELDKLKEEANQWINILTKVEEKLRIQLLKIYNFLEEDQINKLKIEKNIIQNKVGENEKTLEVYNEFLDVQLAALKASHTIVQSELIDEYLSRHSDYINQLFMQISPHAVYRHVHLVPQGKNLYVVMTKEHETVKNLRELGEQELKQQFNASLKFSSGQSNVLALCIFLALNRSQQWTKLKFLGIDDPFQNLDDINIFSFIDVLSQVVSMQNKQLLISTHNEDFSHLIRVKMGIEAERIGNIIFQAYNDQGASVRGNCVVKGEEEIGLN
ncbi:TPA: AAA family ATPase [Bacillus anthracis]|uniref:AAA family ATPase n=1 Tax=Bacillus anthracis TaxID=1392 RepID=UPI0001DBF2B5|nr:SMC family ATPase [Bacillus cereus]HDR4495705.1 SMC family ATPase [Bacillus cereus biovar anthracis]ADK06905.1 hypothetical protein BACI_c43090 [Bacillus cereus biovar anthracis str. CI]HDR6225719.1 SMC family ATPase [Bacillus cereus biovar anthracis]HDR6236756.1 SMC family ATPase [Bacillus cereus biovar anthracis]HDR6250133.1 SMC family ATPase [Bacillus cereus biovar anthracis]